MPKAKTILPDDAYDRIPRAQVTLTDEAMYLTKFDATGKPNVTYPVAAREVARAFNVFGASTGLLPRDILFWMQVGSHTRAGIWLPPAVRTLHFDLGARKTTTLRVPLPGLIFVGQGGDYFIFAAPARPDEPNAPLYLAPLPNVNHGDGKICAGSVQFPACHVSTLHAAADLFFESAFNHDLSDDKVNGIQNYSSLYKILDVLQSQKTFPSKMLRPARLTLANLLEASR